jgi:transposase
MSKARLVLTALFVDHQSPAEVAARYGVHRSWVYKLKARYQADGDGGAGRAATQGTGRGRPGRRTGDHPCGKVERFQQTLKKWLRGQPTQPATPEQLQALIGDFLQTYLWHRPHRSLPHQATPGAVYTRLPKALPATSRDTDTHDRIRHDRIDPSGVVTLRVAGRLHHIGIGRTHARTHVILLVQDLHVRVVNAITGELLRDLALDPTRDYQPTGAPKGPTRTTPK